MEDFERELKVVVVGNGGVGKTTLIRGAAGHGAPPGGAPTSRTIGGGFVQASLTVPSLGADVTLHICDTAGQAELDAVSRASYRGADGGVLVFSTADRASFDALPAWRAKLVAACGARLPMVVVQNKVDLLEQAAVSSSEAEAMARRLGLTFVRACATEGLNVTAAFVRLAELHDRATRLGGGGPLASGAQAEASEPGGAAGGELDGSAGRSASSNAAPAARDVVRQVVRSKLGSSGSGGAKPASVELHPSRRRGRQKLSSRLKAKLVQVVSAVRRRGP
ncbi:RAB23 [Scenedesmus sp. PABB004]|nr:RAB23 [Scenedesmus sp. PABB004]